MEKIRNAIHVINLDTQAPTSRKCELWPDILRVCVTGASGCGKTNAVLNLLLHKKPLTTIFLVSRTTYQDKYLLLKELVDKYNIGKTKTKRIKFVEISLEKLGPPESIDKNSVVIFDDLLAEKNQDKIAAYFMRGRHRGISSFYLTQSFTKIPKPSGIRSNFNYFIIYPTDLVNLKQLYIENVNDISFQKFRELCNQAWKEKWGFLVIDLESEKAKYKKNFEYVFKV